MTPVRQFYKNNQRGNLKATLAVANATTAGADPPGVGAALSEARTKPKCATRHLRTQCDIRPRGGAKINVARAGGREYPVAPARGLSIYGSRCPPISSHG